MRYIRIFYDTIMGGICRYKNISADNQRFPKNANGDIVYSFQSRACPRSFIRFNDTSLVADKSGIVRSSACFSIFFPFTVLLFRSRILQPRDTGRASFINRVTL